VRCCDALPLALRIVGGLLQTQPQLQLSECLQLLSAERQRWEQTRLSYPAIRASFNLSYPRLEARSARLLRLLGLLLEPTVTLKTAAALLETSIEPARASIADLLRVRLLESVGKERYHLPDLLRLLAKGQLAIEESTETRQAARLRLAQAYQDTAEIMSLGLAASSRQQLTALWGRGRADFEQSLLLNAQSWFAIERSNLLAALDWAFQAQAWTIGLALANCLPLFLMLNGESAAAETMLLQAIATSETSDDRLQTAQLLDRLGDIYLQQGEWEKAKAPYQQSLEILRDFQEPVRESQTLTNLGLVYLEQGDRETAATLWAKALTRSSTGATGDRDFTEWMQTTNAALLEAVLLQLGDRQPSRKFLGTIGKLFKRLLS
ncbi:MAG: tetratricopeptide repeat protein, partial [Microcoleus sp. SIO2G3]|nr:tetratricopeptide repeat protein [Microcoleus sp. SIO2G3]